MIEIPDIFKSEDNQYPTLENGGNISQSQWVEFVSQAGLMAESDLPATIKKFTNFDMDSCSETLRAVLLAGQGRCIIRQGEFITGAKLLGKAYELVPEQSHDARAYILLEMVSFLGMIGSFEVSRLLLQQVPLLTKSEYLIKLAYYYTLVQHIRTGKKDVMNDLQQSLNYFTKVKLHSVAAYHHKIMGNLHRRNENYKQAEKSYESAIALAEKHKFTHIAVAVTHDVGMLRFYQKDNAAGVEILRSCVDTAENHYTRGFVLANLGFIHLKLEDKDAALRWFEKALDEITTHGIFHMLPGTCYHLGTIHEKNDQLRLAKFYLEKGNRAANELLKQNFPYNGDRERAVSGYIQFLEKHPAVSGDPMEDLDLSFAIDRPLKEIRGIFQYGVLTHMVAKHGSARQSAKVMDMSERTFHAVQKRVRDFGGADIPNEILQFILDRQDMPWTKLNQRFEAILLKYLLKEYGNKRVASEKLDVTYHHLVGMTRKVFGSRQRAKV